uniref:ORF58c n=1 Tax=Pinus koraiensis TaxID=88728 RepID=A4QM55_PINKO|nr:ORF58c [Pinus koraiensis]
MSCTDSSIPIIAEYSCFMFSNFTRVIHVPSTSPSKALRIAMPIVSARPLRSGDRAKRP